MGNIIDYVNEFQSVNFKEKPFEAVDGLVLACFAYFDFGKLVPSVSAESENVTIVDLSKSSNYEEMFLDTFDPLKSEELFQAMLQSKRFGSIQLNYYVNEHDEKEEKQFSAITVFFEDSAFIAYRGTDNSFVGWKENFNMSYISIIPSQRAASIYIDYISKQTNGKIYLGGHSKGGNLAIYSATYADEKVQNRIVAIYSFDAPGFKEDIHTQEGYLRVVDRILKYVPNSSIVGMLLLQEKNYFIVESSVKGILQHDAFSWVVENGDFVYLDNLREDSVQLNSLLNTLIENISDDERKRLVDIIYRIIIKNKIRTANEFVSNWRRVAFGILIGIKGMSKDTRKAMTQMVRNVFFQMVKMG
ncbi:DUF2974 domain-containing protein [[Clostridium] fimetarium]|uniref:DUF2974 domain-containing protein n=1 Tax=[Clostridium] fimetarium TaxID=99656 RepID=A0A1I0M784_9FIRM|nr:DUF2974 domain-containing protein [[Clostridium] fimetarium]SEV84213.1 Protein of unknown function [[Clostridium] fimetarium]